MKKSPSVVYWLGNSLYPNITNRCPNNCYFCFRKFKSRIQEFNLKLGKEPSSSGVAKELQTVINRKNWSEVVFCGFGEPLERLNCVLEVTRWIKKHYGKVVRIDTNGLGYLLNKGSGEGIEGSRRRQDKRKLERPRKGGVQPSMQTRV